MKCNQCQYWNIPIIERETMLCTNKYTVNGGRERRCDDEACDRFVALGKMREEKEHDRKEENRRPD